MRFLGNLLWLIFGGLIEAAIWLFAGIFFAFTIIGLPLASVCFKMAVLSLSPFGSEVVYSGGSVSIILNVIWIAVIGIHLALANLAMAACMAVTIVGIPFALQYLKLAKLSISPFGTSIVSY